MKIIRVESVQKVDMKPQNYDIFTVKCSFDKILRFLFSMVKTFNQIWFEI